METVTFTGGKYEDMLESYYTLTPSNSAYLSNIDKIEVNGEEWAKKTYMMTLEGKDYYIEQNSICV